MEANYCPQTRSFIGIVVVNNKNGNRIFHVGTLSRFFVHKRNEHQCDCTERTPWLWLGNVTERSQHDSMELCVRINFIQYIFWSYMWSVCVFFLCSKSFARMAASPARFSDAFILNDFSIPHTIELNSSKKSERKLCMSLCGCLCVFFHSNFGLNEQ